MQWPSSLWVDYSAWFCLFVYKWSNALHPSAIFSIGECWVCHYYQNTHIEVRLVNNPPVLWVAFFSRYIILNHIVSLWCRSVEFLFREAPLPAMLSSSSLLGRHKSLDLGLQPNTLASQSSIPHQRLLHWSAECHNLWLSLRPVWR